MKPMSVSEIAKQTGRSTHLVRAIARRLNQEPTHTEPIGRFHRQYFMAEPILEELKKMKPAVSHGPRKW